MERDLGPLAKVKDSGRYLFMAEANSSLWEAAIDSISSNPDSEGRMYTTYGCVHIALTSCHARID